MYMLAIPNDNNNSNKYRKQQGFGPLLIHVEPTLQFPISHGVSGNYETLQHRRTWHWNKGGASIDQTKL